MSDNVGQLQVRPQDARNRAMVDLNFFAGLVIPHVITFGFPAYYQALFRFITSAQTFEQFEYRVRIAIGLPRGFTKTTFLKILVCWLICHDKFSFLAIICSTEPRAVDFVADVHNMMQEENIRILYGDWTKGMIVDNKQEKQTRFHDRLVILISAGAGTSVRGMNKDNRRPDFLLCDDMQTKENDESETESLVLFNWFVGTLLKFVAPSSASRVVIFYIGNMYSTTCILFKLKEHPQWLSLVTGCITEDGDSLWSELHPVEALMDDFFHDEQLGKADEWFAEMMNDPVAREDAMLSGPIPMTRYPGPISPEAAFVTIDPAGFKTGSDDNVICGHQVMNDKWHIAEMEGGKLDPKTVCRTAISMCMRLEGNLIGVEDVAYQSTLAFWMNEYLTEHHISGIQCIGLKVGTTAKERRIRAFFKEMYAGAYSFLRDMDRMKVSWQAGAYRSGKKNNKDDWLDAPALGLVVRNQHRALLGIRREQSAPSPGVQDNNSAF